MYNRRQAALVLAVIAAFLPLPAAAQEVAGRARELAPQFEKALYENIVDFWLPRSIDRENGGYRIDFDEKGEPRGPGSKGVVTQARMVWFWARLTRTGRDVPGHERAEIPGARLGNINDR